MTYDYLWNDDVTLSAEADKFVSENLWNGPPTRTDAYFLDELIVGEALAAGAAQWYYRTIQDVRVPQHWITWFLEQNLVSPLKFHPSDFVRRLTIQLAWGLPDLHENLNGLLSVCGKQGFDLGRR